MLLQLESIFSEMIVFHFDPHYFSLDLAIFLIDFLDLFLKILELIDMIFLEFLLLPISFSFELHPLSLYILKFLNMLLTFLVKYDLNFAHFLFEFIIFKGQLFNKRFQFELLLNELTNVLTFVLSQTLVVSHLFEDLVWLQL